MNTPITFVEDGVYRTAVGDVTYLITEIPSRYRIFHTINPDGTWGDIVDVERHFYEADKNVLPPSRVGNHFHWGYGVRVVPDLEWIATRMDDPDEEPIVIGHTVTDAVKRLYALPNTDVMP